LLLFFKNQLGLCLQILSRLIPHRWILMHTSLDGRPYLQDRDRSFVWNGGMTPAMRGAPGIGALFHMFTLFKMLRELLFGRQSWRT
jgi:hypothetical protein